MKTKEQVIQKIKEIGNDYSDYADHVEKILLPIGTELLHRKVKGQKIIGYQVDKNDSGIGPSATVKYLTNEGNKIGIARESSLHN